MTIDELVAHTHPAPEGSFIIQSSSGGYAGGEYPVKFVPTTGNAGASKPFNVMQPTLVVNGFIKT